MIVGLGMDLVEIARIRRAMENPRFLERVLTPTEREFAVTPAQVAGRWAAKEAIYKALGIPLSWQDVEVLPAAHGAPRGDDPQSALQTQAGCACRSRSRTSEPTRRRWRWSNGPSTSRRSSEWLSSYNAVVRDRTLVLTLAITVGIGLALLVGLLRQGQVEARQEEIHRRRTAPVAFDRALWLKETDSRIDDETNWRKRMVDDVARRWVLPGMSRTALLRLLGPGQPLSEKDYRDWTAGTDPRLGRDPHVGGKPILAYWTFCTGDNEYDSGATEYLYVFFDAQDRVVRAEVNIAM